MKSITFLFMTGLCIISVISILIFIFDGGFECHEDNVESCKKIAQLWDNDFNKMVEKIQGVDSYIVDEALETPKYICQAIENPKKEIVINFWNNKNKLFLLVVITWMTFLHFIFCKWFFENAV